MESDLSNFSNVMGFIAKNTFDVPAPAKNILAFVDWLLYCKPNTEPADHNTVYNSWVNCNPSFTCRSATMEWELYRNFYLQLKSKYLTQVKAQVSPGCTDCFIGKDALTSASNTGLLLGCTTNPPPGPAHVQQ